MRRVLFLAIAVLVGSGPFPLWAAEDITLENNLTYATVGDVKLQLDLAKPATGKGPFPCIVFIHGGGWSGGNRHAYRTAIETAARKGYVAVTVSYRLTQPDPQTGQPKEPFPAQIHDCKAAVRWVRAHANEHQIDPQKIGVTGGSAGGHLSLLVGLTDAKDGLEGELGNGGQSSRVQAVCNVFGPTDMPVLFQSTPAVYGLVKALCNGTLEEQPAMYKAVSPVTYISKDDPPVLTLHGSDDKLVPVEQAMILDKAMKAAGLSHELLILEGQGHGFGGQAAVKADTAMWTFFDQHLKK